MVRLPGHGRRLDYVLIGSWHAHPAARAAVAQVELIGTEPVDGVWCSDHFGVFADLDVVPDESDC